MKITSRTPLGSSGFSQRTAQATSSGLNLLLAGLLMTLAPCAFGQSDNFDDGDDVGWTRYDRLGATTFSFPSGGYRWVGLSTGPNEADKALAFATRTNNYTNFYASVDLVAWDDNSVTNARSAIGLAFRAADIGPGTTKSLVAYWTPAINGGGLRVFSIYYIWNDLPIAAVAATLVTFETTNKYRLVATGTGDFIEAKIYNLRDLTKPVAYVGGHLDGLGLEGFGLPASGKCGLFLYSRNNTTVSVTFDNYFAAATDPVSVPAPAIAHPVAGTPQVVNRVPASNQNLHPAASGITFNASTLGGNTIDAAGIKLLLNGTDVSPSLTIGGAGNNRSVSYTGLQSNKVYHALISLTETGGKTSTNEFHFDTFTDAFLSSTGTVMMVETEDFNYSNGQFQDNPPPSGVDAFFNQVNGNGVGYYMLEGTPDVDYYDRRSNPEADYQTYRFSDRPGTFAGALYYLTDGGTTTVFTNDTALQKFASLALPDYHVVHTEGGEWLNYTRTFNPGKYHAYLRLSCISAQDVLFDEVTGDRTLPGQTTINLGKFNAAQTGHISTYRYFPLVDNSGSLVELNWSGVKTFRLTAGGPQQDLTRYTLDFNYLVFVPAPQATASPFSLINPQRSGATFSVSFPTESGFTYTLRYKNALTDPDWISTGATAAGDGTVKTLQDISSQSNRFYRVSAQ